MKKVRLDKIFYALSDENRLKIISIINLNIEVCGCDILEQLSITQPTMAYHMKILHEAGIVSCRKNGKWCIYKLEKDRISDITKFIDKFKISEANNQ